VVPHLSGVDRLIDVWVRATTCFRKIDGEWIIVHEHASVPLYMEGSNRASIDLTPKSA
jgi:ketosteroid isomerase-like protein